MITAFAEPDVCLLREDRGAGEGDDLGVGLRVGGLFGHLDGVCGGVFQQRGVIIRPPILRGHVGVRAEIHDIALLEPGRHGVLGAHADAAVGKLSLMTSSEALAWMA